MIDAHVHLITKEMLDDTQSHFSALLPEAASVFRANAGRVFCDGFVEFISRKSLREFADDWLRAMDANGLDKAVFFPISERLEQMRDFVRMAPDRFCGYAILDHPTAENAPEKLRRAVEEYGLKGLKLYPSLHRFRASDSAVFPLYAEAQRLEIPITFHFGISTAPIADYSYTNPIDLNLALRLFPRLTFIVAHFGAGYFRELCMLGYHSKNLYVDTSGTNNWRDYLPETYPLEEVFRKTAEIVSPGRILFGTDSALGRGDGYRTAIKEEQTRIVRSLGLGEEDEKNILGDNARRLFA